eukprot:jgi/Tetstr1/436850/TSEL_025627.t1
MGARLLTSPASPRVAPTGRRGAAWSVGAPPQGSAAPRSVSTAAPPSPRHRASRGPAHSRGLDRRRMGVWASAPVEARTVSGEGEGTFEWTRNWYPLARASDLEDGRPSELEVLGKPLACWKDGAGEWRVVDDACPHKLAPLSLGKVTPEGDLMCRYHGYCYNGRGECTRLPMAVSEASEAKACRLPQSKAISYPTQLSQGLLWVWPDASPERWVEAQMSAPPPDPRGGSAEFMMAEAPIDFTMFLENAHDPCHANFLHEGLGFGLTKYSPESAVPMRDFKLDGKISSRGFVLKHGGYSASTDGQLATRAFTAPSTADTTYIKPSGVMQTRLYFLPVRPGYTRFFASFQFAMPTDAQKAELEAAKRNQPAGQDEPVARPPKASPLDRLRKLQAVASFVLPGLLMKVFPKYVGEAFRHTASTKLGDQDNMIMAGTERYMQKRNQTRPMGDWTKEYALLTPSDQGIVAFRRWLNKFASGGPWGGAMPFHSAEVTQAQLLDRWNTHTKHCRSCRRTLSLFAKLSQAAGKLAVALAVASLGAAVALWGAPSQAPCVLAVLALLCHAAHLKFRFEQRRLLSGVPGAGEGPPVVDPWAGFH